MPRLTNAEYEVWLCNDRGARLELLDDFLSLDATRSIDEIGQLHIALPPSFDYRKISIDYQVQLWRAPPGRRLALWAVYFIRQSRLEQPQSEDWLHYYGVMPVELLRRRVVAFNEGDTEANKTDYADDMIREIVDEQMVSAATAARNYAGLSVAAELSAGPTLTKTFEYQNVYDVLRDIRQASKVAGTEVFFDIVPDSISANDITFQFRTYTSQPGRDVSDRMTFDAARGNLIAPSLSWDYSQTYNYVYAMGQGEEDNRTSQEVSDSTLIGYSAWNRREEYATAIEEETANGVREAGRTHLQAGRPYREFSAQPVDVEGSVYGIDWDVGDVVRARYFGSGSDMVVRADSIYLESGFERVSVRLGWVND